MQPMTTPAPTSGRETLLRAARAELVEHGHAGISLRAVARRAGVSHAAPKYHFQDRAGLLTAVATEGFNALATHLHQRVAGVTDLPIAELGKAYIDFGLANPALFDLMFRPSELHENDPALMAAEERAFGALMDTIRTGAEPGATEETVTELALASWGLVHGLVVLARDGALAGPSGAATPEAATELTHRLADLFTQRMFATTVSSAGASGRPATGPQRRPRSR